MKWPKIKLGLNRTEAGKVAKSGGIAIVAGIVMKLLIAYGLVPEPVLADPELMSYLAAGITWVVASVKTFIWEHRPG